MDTPLLDFKSVVETNLIGTVNACRAAIALLASQDDGGMLFNVDGAGATGEATAFHGPYGCTKAALRQLTWTLSAELAADQDAQHVGVHVVSPGTMMITKLLMGNSTT